MNWRGRPQRSYPPAVCTPSSRHRSPDREPIGDELALLSVIIPCRDAEGYVGRQLDALASQETSFPWELILVDNGSTDRSVQIAETYADRMQLRVVSAPDRANQAYARNV